MGLVGGVEADDDAMAAAGDERGVRGARQRAKPAAARIEEEGVSVVVGVDMEALAFEAHPPVMPSGTGQDDEGDGGEDGAEDDEADGRVHPLGELREIRPGAFEQGAEGAGEGGEAAEQAGDERDVASIVADVDRARGAWRLGHARVQMTRRCGLFQWLFPCLLDSGRS